MKFEEIIKNKLNQHRETYDVHAWENLSKQLDSQNPMRFKNPSNRWVGWSVAGIVAVLVVIIGGYFTFKQPTTSKNTSNTASVTTQKSTPTQEEKTISPKKSTSNDSKIRSTKDQPDPLNQLHQFKQTPAIQSATILSTTEPKADLSKDADLPEVLIIKNSLKTKPTLENWSNIICPDDDTKWTNTNPSSVSFVSDQQRIDIASGKTIALSSLPTGTYTVIYENVNYKQFTVVGTPTIEWHAEPIVYENGLPFIPLKANIDASFTAATWSLNGEKIGSNASQVKVPAFQKGKETVTLQLQQEGCQVSNTYSVMVNNDYNLLAMTAFNPESSNERNRVFLPFALYERNTEFEMQIINPSTGEIIFVTHSSSQPWDGRNQKTGELVPANQRYIWSVRLKEKMPLEKKSIYQGLVIRVAE